MATTPTLLPSNINREQQGVVFQRHRDLKVVWNLIVYIV